MQSCSISSQIRGSASISQLHHSTGHYKGPEAGNLNPLDTPDQTLGLLSQACWFASRRPRVHMRHSLVQGTRHHLASAALVAHPQLPSRMGGACFALNFVGNRSLDWPNHGFGAEFVATKGAGRPDSPVNCPPQACHQALQLHKSA